MLCILGSAMFVASADIITYNFNLDGGQEVPPNASGAVGAAQLVYDTDTMMYDMDLMAFGIGLGDLLDVGPNSTPVHVHMAPAGANGPIVVDLGFASSFFDDGLGIRLQINDALFGGTQGGVDSDPAVVRDALLAGNLYVNIHTSTYGGGEIRGQIVPEPASLALMLLGLVPAIRRGRPG
jgi:hypothetical protein